jgi:hypothetical protein
MRPMQWNWPGAHPAEGADRLNVALAVQHARHYAVVVGAHHVLVEISSMRLSAAVDGNQKAEVKKLRDMGYSFQITSELGRGRQDGICASGGRDGVNLLVEWKLDRKLQRKSTLTEDQVKFHREWKGPLLVARAAEEVHAEMQRLLARLR